MPWPLSSAPSHPHRFLPPPSAPCLFLPSHPSPLPVSHSPVSPPPPPPVRPCRRACVHVHRVTLAAPSRQRLTPPPSPTLPSHSIRVSSFFLPIQRHAMAPFAPRCCALALLCAVLVLAGALVRAEPSTVTSDITMTNELFDGYTMTLDLSSSSADVVTVQLMNSQVSGKGFTVSSSRGGTPSSARLSMSMTSTTVTQSVITFSGVMPANSDIRIVATTGTLAPTQSLFDFRGLALDESVTFTVENTAVTWPKDSMNTGSILLINPGKNAVGIKSASGLFVFNATATRGASVVKVSTQSSFPITKGSALAIDYGTCDMCSSALLSIDVPLVVDSSSLLRVANCKVTGAGNGLLSSAGSTTVKDMSAYLIYDNVVAMGGLFSFQSGLENSGAYPFRVSDNSIVSFLSLRAPSTGIATGHKIPSEVIQSQSVGGDCVIGNTHLTTTSDYVGRGLNVNTIVDAWGASNGICVNAKCVPGNTRPGSTPPAGKPCTCQCSSTSHNPPFCTAVPDPMQNGILNAKCAVPNCATCDRLEPSKRCTQCNNGYSVNVDYQCKIIPTTTTTTTTTTTRPPACVAPGCSKCMPGSGTVCSSCRNGYTLLHGACKPNVSGAPGVHTASLAAVVSVVAALYAL
ncbi:hypothetical protein, conserved in leishmania [Leishmania tarentolae]|uniref:Surface antigen-like protein n=1 Tax=Leishmania tarentolae TaxID=5689 RepID=A0A640KDN5_LEITA|nr:hypothetical protein, conserved in leishmania [Leishmania tarentolae]